jgi:tetratricopeptide (TPR) repeat protein
MRRYRTEILVGLLLVTATLLAYWPALFNDFVYYDDHVYVTENPQVKEGLTDSTIRWALTSGYFDSIPHRFYAANWHPLTWLSLQLDSQLYRSKAWGFHLTSILLHIANAVLLFAALRQMTKAIWPSAFVAALFAEHPLHVESVAWVAERKDVLSTFFWMLTLLAYGHYASKPSRGRLAVVVGVFALGLTAKPMLVTLPFVLLLLDYWPLGRFGLDKTAAHGSGKRTTVQTTKTWLRLIPPRSLVREKMPLFILSAVSCVVTLIAQSSGGAVISLEHLPVQERLANALNAWVVYIGKMCWPQGLSVFYPYDHSISLYWHALVAGVVLVGLSVFAYRQLERRPYIAVGWLWYVGTLIPVIGLVQVGDQAYADRYTYIPLIGLFLMLAWGIPDLLAGWRLQEIVLTSLGITLVLSCVLYSWLQVHYWQDDLTLWAHALEVNPENAVAHNNLAIDLSKLGNLEDSLGHFDAAVRIDPRYVGARENRQKAQAQIYFSRATSLSAKGDLDGAISSFQALLRLVPDDVVAHYELGSLFAQQESWGEAAAAYRRALGIQPGLLPAHCGLALALSRTGQNEAAQEEYQKAFKLDPRWPQAAAREAWAKATDREPTRRNRRLALQLAEEVCEATNYQDAGFVDTLAAAYAALGRFERAVATARKAHTLALTAKQENLAREIARRIQLYEKRQALTETGGVPEP